MTTAVLIPYSPSGPERIAAFDYVTRYYASQHPQLDVVVGQAAGVGERWSKAGAVEIARRAAPDADVLVVADADVLVPPAKLTEALMLVEAGIVEWAVPYTFVHRFSAQATRRLLVGRPASMQSVDRAPRQGTIGGGVVVIRSSVYETVGLDPRFVGWGGDDTAWGLALTTLHPTYRRLDGRCFHLWHPHENAYARRRPQTEQSADLLVRYREAANHPDEMRALLAEFA